MVDLPSRRRLTARILLRNDAGSVLLLRFTTSRHDDLGVLRPWEFWAAPGGEIEPGETAAAAARRELAEELGLVLEVTGPILEEETVFEHQGSTMRNRNHFFTASCTREAPVLGGVDARERAVLSGLRWWTLAELRCTRETVYPAWLARWLAGAAACAGGRRGTPPGLLIHVR